MRFLVAHCNGLNVESLSLIAVSCGSFLFLHLQVTIDAHASVFDAIALMSRYVVQRHVM
jgi:hypothetical protein